MALKRRSRINPTFSVASMTDIVFLLLIFFMISSTLLRPNTNALKLLLPRSTSQIPDKPVTRISIDARLNYYFETTPVSIKELETILKQRLAGENEPIVSLSVDKSVPMEEVVKVLNIAKDNKFKLILATQPLNR